MSTTISTTITTTSLQPLQQLLPTPSTTTTATTTTTTPPPITTSPTKQLSTNRIRKKFGQFIKRCKLLLKNIGSTSDVQIETFIDDQLHLFQMSGDLKTIFRPLYTAIIRDIQEKSTHPRYSNCSDIFIAGLLPRKLFTVLEEVGGFLYLLEINANDTDRRCTIVDNLAQYIIDYVVFLHGYYVLRSTERCYNGLTPKQYYGEEVIFPSLYERNAIVSMYSIPIKIVINKWLKKK